MKKPQINPEDLLKDLDIILKNIELLGKDNLNKKDINIIGIKINKDSKNIKNKYKDLDSEE
tara:strand:+ start:267 stop:449 length:183 start_codon:yes stop_codon:yes gene_type:complete